MPSHRSSSSSRILNLRYRFCPRSPRRLGSSRAPTSVYLPCLYSRFLPLRRKTSAFTTTQNFFFRSSSGVPVTRRSPSKRPKEGPLPVSRGPGHAYHFSTLLSSTITTLSFSYVKNTKIHQLTYKNLRIGTNWHDFKHKTSHDPLDPHKQSQIPVCLVLRFTFLELFARPDTATMTLLVH